MKNILFYLFITVTITGTFMIKSCTNKKWKMKIESNLNIHKKKIEPFEKEKKDTIYWYLDTKNKPIFVPKITTIQSPLIPHFANKCFKNYYPTPINCKWTKDKKLFMLNDFPNYQANFTIDDKIHTITYTKDGKWLETKEQILIDQFPPNISNAIKIKYPDYKIIHASTFKNQKISGCYLAILKNYNEEKEIILTEGGKFIK